MEKLAWLVPALPLVAWAVLLLLGKRLPGGGRRSASSPWPSAG